MDDLFVPDRKLQEDRQARVCLVLIFAGAADMDVVIAVSPVIRKPFIKSLRTLGDKIELQV